MNYQWLFPQTVPYVKRGKGIAGDNFTQEDRTGLEILVREALQNSLDAALPSTKTVRVNIKLLKADEFNNNYLKSLLTLEYLERLKTAGNGAEIDLENSSVLVIEDFGTMGLIGDYLDNDRAGPNENWNAFWHTEGEGAKGSRGSNGGAGQGKITYIQIGAARCLFGLTNRSSDGRSLLMGRSEFRGTYVFGNHKYLRDSYWGVHDCGAPHPVTNEKDIKEFEEAFHLHRGKDSGLSLVVPFPVELKINEIKQIIISEYYFPIVSQRLVIQIGSTIISEENIDIIADEIFSDPVAREKKSSFTKDFRRLARTAINLRLKNLPHAELAIGWNKDQSLKEDSIKFGDLENLRKLVDSEEVIHVRCPIQIKPKNSTPLGSFIDVFLQVPQDLDRVEEAYIRKDLLIGSENHLSKNTYLQKARALTLISDASLSSFLVDAEEATHLKWNSRREKVKDGYTDAISTLSSVRQAAPKMLALLTNSGTRRDVKALAKYFTKSAGDSKKIGAGKSNKNGKDVKPPIIDIPNPTPKPFSIVTTNNSIKVRPNKAFSNNGEDYQTACALEVAYEGLDQNPFKSYDPFDFDLSDEINHPVVSRNLTITERRFNKIYFQVKSSDFSLEVSGFDPNLRFYARLNYEHNS